MVQGELGAGAKNGSCFRKDLLARGKNSYAFAWNTSLGPVAFCVVDSVPAAIGCSKAESSFANMK